MTTYVTLFDPPNVEITHKNCGDVVWSVFDFGNDFSISIYHSAPLRITPDREPLFWLATFDIDLAHRIQALPSYPDGSMQWEEDYQWRCI